MFGKSQKNNSNKSQSISLPEPEAHDDPLVNFTGGTTFGFSGTSLDNLQSSEYSLVGLGVDSSLSISPFVNQLEECLKTTVESLQLSPRSDNLLLRVIRFDRDTQEIHGFQELPKCDLDKYTGILTNLGSSTCLYDATVDLTESINSYGKQLSKDYEVNGILFVLTDGLNNIGIYGPRQVKEKFSEGVGEGKLQSLTTILVGVNIQDYSVKNALEEYSKEAGFDSFIPLEKADKNSLAKLAKFIQRSVSNVSQKINNPTASVNLTF
jgi:hypothetical protein